MYASVIEKNPTVRTTHGQIRGQNRRGIAVFRGIPYGHDCDGKNRFLPAGPANDWDGVRDCTKNGPVAMQRAGSISGGDNPLAKYFSGGHPEEIGWEDEVFSENCLVLNVLTPGLDDKMRPVVVYIHGGGFMSGSGTLTLGADVWCDEEDIVVVGINHRLNAFGYLYLGAFDDQYARSGAAGMSDCVLALEWVRDNIASFGGDPDKVTIMGESGGGCKVNALCAMESAKGLFRAAIVESGSGRPGTKTPEAAACDARKLMAELQISPAQLEKIFEVSGEAILQAMEKLDCKDMDFSPVGDGVAIPQNPMNKYLEADPSKPLLVGSSEEEMAIFIPPAPDQDFTEETLKKSVLDLIRNVNSIGRPDIFLPIAEDKVDAFIAAYKANDKKGVTPQHLFLQICSMNEMLGKDAYVQAMEKAQKKQGRVYSYFVTYDAPLPGADTLRYSWHTADLPLQMRVVLHPESELLSKTMARAWAAFIRNGSPDTKELPWPQFTADEKKTMVLDYDCRIETDPTKPFRDALNQ